jgi:hypothetical protein
MLGALFQCPCGTAYPWRHTLVSHQTWRCQTWRCLWTTGSSRGPPPRPGISEQQQQQNFINEQWESTGVRGRILAGPEALYRPQDVRQALRLVAGRPCTLPLPPGARGYSHGLPLQCFFRLGWPKHARFIWFMQSTG